MEVIHELNAKLDKIIIKLDPGQYAASAALLYLKVDGACKKIDLIHKSFVKLVATVESMRKVFEETIPAITDFVASRSMEGMEIIADEV